jgi:hypothetical protein
MLEGSLIEEIIQLSADMDKSIEDQEEYGRKLAEAERDYQVVLRKKALEEKADGTPVTFISQFIRGDEEIAEKRMQRDIAEALYQAAKDRTVGIRLRIKIVDAQASREWSVAGPGDISDAPYQP